jgi:DNA-binding winged helix-turn-helix (wHTH) protein
MFVPARESLSVRFGDCRLDPDARQLSRDGRAVPLSPKAFELLKLLVEQRPRALSKAELLERVWPGIFVSDASLARVINEIRRGVGDRARVGRIIRTVHAFGYAFAADVKKDGPTDVVPAVPAQCWFACQGREYALADGEHIVGREPGLTIRLDSPKVSRRHAAITVRGARATIEDLGSKNGTFVRGVRIGQTVALKPGDAVRIGGFRLIFHVSAELRSTETEIHSRS